MIASLHKHLLPLKGSVGVCTLLVCAALFVGPLWAQDTTAPEQAEEQGQAAPTEATDERPNDENLGGRVSRERYYLGDSPKMRRQKGPALGRPQSILPQPFVPKGSVIVPPAPIVEPQLLPEGEEQGALTSDTMDLASSEPPLEGSTVTMVDQEADSAEAQFLEAAALELLDPSGIGLLPVAESYGASFWADYDRAAVVKGYEAYQGDITSRALAVIAKKIAKSGVTLPAPEEDGDVLAIVQARLSLLASLGDTAGYISLLERLPVERDWSALVKDFTNKHLLKGELTDACALAAAERATDADSYWLRLAAFCQAAQGNRVGVDFQLGILEEVSQIRPTFYQLIDQILIEASQAPGTVVAEVAALSNSLQVDLLEVTMARLARAKVPLLALDDVNPLAVRMMLSLPGVERAAKIDLMGLAVRRTWLDAESLAAFAVNHQPLEDETEAALAAPESDRRFVIDAALASLSSQADAGSLRADALSKLWERSVEQRIVANTAGGYISLTKDILPTSKAGKIAAVLTRAALIGGDQELAHQWFTALRAESAGSAVVDRDLVGLAPLLAVVGGDNAPNISEQLLSLWWQGEAEQEDRYAKASLLFTTLEALGVVVPEQSWNLLEGGPAVFAGTTPSVALWRRYLIAVQNQDVPKALALSFSLMSEGGPATVSGALAGSLLGGLMELGLEKEARLIAIEMLVGQGL